MKLPMYNLETFNLVEMLQENCETVHEVLNRFVLFKIKPSSYFSSEVTRVFSQFDHLNFD